MWLDDKAEGEPREHWPYWIYPGEAFHANRGPIARPVVWGWNSGEFDYYVVLPQEKKK